MPASNVTAPACPTIWHLVLRLHSYCPALPEQLLARAPRPAKKTTHDRPVWGNIQVQALNKQGRSFDCTLPTELAWIWEDPSQVTNKEHRVSPERSDTATQAVAQRYAKVSSPTAWVLSNHRKLWTVKAGDESCPATWHFPARIQKGEPAANPALTLGLFMYIMSHVFVHLEVDKSNNLASNSLRALALALPRIESNVHFLQFLASSLLHTCGQSEGCHLKSQHCFPRNQAPLAIVQVHHGVHGSLVKGTSGDGVQQDIF